MPRKSPQLAKLSRPRLNDALPRARLFSLLDEKRKYPVIWIAGPPGAGKTTLVASYWQNRKQAGIWFHVDSGDADLSTFFYYLTEAAKPFSAKSRSLPLLTPEYLPDVPGFARRYFRELFSRLPDGGVLVLDNYQEAPRAGTFQEVMVNAAAEVPGHVNVVVLSRTEPSGEFSRHLASGTVALIGWDELKLTYDEAQSIAVSRSRVDRETLRYLYQRSEGWAAGLTLMLERLRGGALTTQEVETQSRQGVFDYFVAQIFRDMPVRDQQILMRTALFESFTEGLAQDLTGIPRCGELFDHLCDRQLFTYRKFGEKVRYQYHDLFREFLKVTLTSSVGPGELRGISDRAGMLLVERDLDSEALPLLCAARNWVEAANLILRAAPKLLAQGRGQTLVEWIAGLPAGQVDRNAWLIYWIGMARMQIDLQGAREALERAYAKFADIDDKLGQILCAAAVLNVHFLEYNDFAPVDLWIDRSTRLLEQSNIKWEPGQELYVLSAILSATAMRQPDHPTLRAWSQRVYELIRQPVDLNQKLSAGISLITYYGHVLDIERGESVIEAVNDVASHEELSPLNRAHWWLESGYFVEKTANREACLRAYEKSVRIADDNGLRQTAVLSRCFRVYHDTCWGNVESAQAIVNEMPRVLDWSQAADVSQYHLACCCLGLLKGDGAYAAKHGEAGYVPVEGIGSPVLNVIWLGLGAHGFAKAGRYDEAERWLDRAWSESGIGFLGTYRAWLLMVRVLSAFELNQREKCEALLRQALDQARETDSAWFFRWMMGDESRLFAMALERNIETGYVLALIRRLHSRPPGSAPDAWPWPLRIYTLGEFRIEIDGHALSFARKAPKKPLALLKAIVAMGGRSVPEQKLIDALWPHEEGDAAGEAFAISLHRLRRLLLHANAVQLIDGLISLDAQKVWVDVWAFDRVCAAFDQSEPENLGDKVDRLWSIYRGHFLADEAGATWAVPLRERLRSRFMRMLSTVARSLEHASENERALELYRRGIEADDLAEEFYQGAIRCLLGMDRHAEALALLRRLRHVLSVTLGIKPSAKTEDLLRSVQGA